MSADEGSTMSNDDFYSRNLAETLLVLLDDQRRLTMVYLESTNKGGSRALLDDMEALLSLLSRDVESVRQRLDRGLRPQFAADR
jgi:hypothetical protein